MKLELKHLAPYLPYKMKFVIDMYEFTEGNCIPEIRHFTMGNDLSMCLNYGKPILRPLSDLTKEIEHNGEKFVPLRYLEININWYSLEQWKSDHKLVNVEEYNKLLSWHFDVFGLIEKGLAIDINNI